MNCCVNELRSQLSATDTVISLPWVHSAYHEFKSRLQNLSRMMSIEPQIALDLLKTLSSDGDEMVRPLMLRFVESENEVPFFTRPRPHVFNFIFGLET